MGSACGGYYGNSLDLDHQTGQCELGDFQNSADRRWVRQERLAGFMTLLELPNVSWKIVSKTFHAETRE